MKIKNLLLLPVILLGAQAAFGMQTVERVTLDEAMLQKLKPIPKLAAYGDARPDLKKYQQHKRRFIAKMDSFGMDRYFSFKTEADADALIKAARGGAGWDPEWFYYDVDADEPTLVIRKIAPNVIVIHDDNSDDEHKE